MSNWFITARIIHWKFVSTGSLNTWISCRYSQCSSINDVIHQPERLVLVVETGAIFIFSYIKIPFCSIFYLWQCYVHFCFLLFPGNQSINYYYCNALFFLCLMKQIIPSACYCFKRCSNHDAETVWVNVYEIIIMHAECVVVTALNCPQPMHVSQVQLWMECHRFKDGAY